MTDPVIPENPRRTPLVASAGQTNFQFDFDGVTTVDDLRVYINGVETTDFTLTANSKTVTLGTPSAEDDSVVIEGQLAIQRLRDYPRGGELQTARLNPEMNFIVRVMQELRRDVNRAITFSKAQIGASNILPLFTEVGHALVSGPTGIEISDVKVTDLDEALQAAEGHADAAAQAIAAVEGVRDETETARDLTLGYRDEAISARDAAQAAAAGMKWRDPVVVATTANISLSGAQTINGVSVVAGDRVLVKDQSTAAQNGVYVVASGAWSRATDCDTWSEIVSQVVTAQQGSVNPDTPYICTNNPGGTLGSTSVTWVVLPIPLADGAVSTAAKIVDGILTYAKMAAAAIASVADIVSGTASKLVDAATLKSFIDTYQGRVVHTQVPTVSANLEVGYNFLANKRYEIEYNDIEVSSNNTALFLEMSADGGATWVNIAASYKWIRWYGTTGVGGDNNASATQIALTGYGMLANAELNGILTLIDPNNANKQPRVCFEYDMTESSGSLYAAGLTRGRRTANMACNRIRLVSSSNFKAQGKLVVREYPL